MEIGKTFCGRTDGWTDGHTSVLHRQGDDLKIGHTVITFLKDVCDDSLYICVGLCILTMQRMTQYKSILTDSLTYNYN